MRNRFMPLGHQQGAARATRGARRCRAACRCNRAPARSCGCVERSGGGGAALGRCREAAVPEPRRGAEAPFRHRFAFRRASAHGRASPARLRRVRTRSLIAVLLPRPANRSGRGAHHRRRHFPGTARKRKSNAAVGRSGSYQNRTHARQDTTCTGLNDLLDHLVGAAERRRKSVRSFKGIICVCGSYTGPQKMHDILHG